MNYIDLFSGVGGFHQGLVEAGFKFDKCYHSEIDKHAKSIYQKHFPESEDLGDVTRIDVSRFPVGQYIVTGGWPCQDNSIAGKRKGQSGGVRSSLFSEIIRILRGLISMGSSVIFIGENVKGLYSVNDKVDFHDTITRLTDLDTDSPQLNLEVQLLNTRWFLPQNRERIYFVGYSGKGSGSKIFPIGEDDETFKRSEVGKEIAKTIDKNYHKGHSSDGFGGRQLIQVGNVDQKGHNSLWGRVYSPEGCSATLNAKGGGMGAKTGLYEVRAVMTPERPNKSQHGRITKGPGEPMFTLTGQDKHGVEVGPFIEQKGRGFNKGGKKDICPPITNNAFEHNNHVSGIRRLTPVECERLQGFQDGWTAQGKDGQIISDTQRYKCVGNSVSVPVVRAIAIRVRSLFLDDNF